MADALLKVCSKILFCALQLSAFNSLFIIFSFLAEVFQSSILAILAFEFAFPWPQFITAASQLATDNAATDALIAENIRSRHVYQQSQQAFQQAMLSSNAQLVSSFDKLANVIVVAFVGGQETPSDRASPNGILS